MLNPQQVKDSIDRNNKDGRWGLAIQTFIVDLYNEMNKLARQNLYLRHRLEGMSHEDAMAKVFGKGATTAAAVAATDAPAALPQTAETSQEAPAQEQGGTRIGANGEPLTPEEEERERMMDAAVESGVKSGIATRE